MKKDKLFKIYSAIFIGICLVPSICMPFVETDSAEKRKLSEFPSVKTENEELNFEFFDQFDTWFSEHFAFRQQFVNADSRIKSAITMTSPDKNVIIGENGWLYYGDTTDDFLNINTLGNREIKNIAHNLRMIDEYCKNNGAEFIFFSAPNKNSIYPENMPFNYIPANACNNYTLLSAEIAGENFWLDMKSSLLNANASVPLYHKTDTHWNNLGAYAGHTEIMTKLGENPCSAGTQWYTENDRLGDLAQMIYPIEKAKDTQIYNDYEYSYVYNGHFRGLDDLTINTTNENADGELIMFRDSYGEAILPYMAECFNSAEFSRVVPYRLNNIENKTVVFEIVERNLGDLQKYAPLMPAPVADISGISAEIYSGDDVVIKTAEINGYTHIYGVLPDDFFSDDDNNIFVETGGVTYKAFNCFEDKDLDCEGEHSGNGFSLYIPAEKVIDDIKITVVGSNGKAVVSN